MHNNRSLALLFLLLTGFLSSQVAAQTTSDLKREKSWADQVVDTVVVGDPVWLNARRIQFLALYSAPKAQAKSRGVILIHGRGVHPAWGFIDNLRADITEAGFHTLSLQMPILEANAPFGAYGKTFGEAFERIEVGIHFLKQKGIKEVVLIGHSSGAMTAVAYVAKHSQSPVTGIVAIGLSTFANGPDTMQPVVMLKSVHLPVLDIFGANDLDEVLTYVDKRRASAQQAGNKGYRAIRVPDADHFFTWQYVALRNHIVNWLERAAGQ
jgi:pimeloyl-ACP methyl ester carboxylesterase